MNKKVVLAEGDIHSYEIITMATDKEDDEIEFEWYCKRYVHQGKAYKVVDVSSLPPGFGDFIYDVDFSNPDGWGSGSLFTQSLVDFRKEKEGLL